MKRNINKENYDRIQTKYMQRTWTFSAKESADWSSSFNFWNINKYQWLSQSNYINDKLFPQEHSTDVRLGKFRDFLSEREKNQPLPPGIHDETIKAYVLLNEAGSGKTTYLTWLAHELFQGHSTRWIVKLKLIECSFVFSKYEQNETLNETAALRLLFRLIYLAFLAPNINSEAIENAKKADKSAQKCAEAIYISNKGVELDATKIEPNIACRMLVLLRIFRLKSERKQTFLLLDGFDEIAPTYKQTTLALLSWLGGFEGICKLYLTSRPYGFRQDFEQALKTCLFYRLNKFLDEDILYFAYRFVSENWKDSSEVNRISLAGLLHTLARRFFGDMGEIPLFLTIGLELLQHEVEKHFDFESGKMPPAFEQGCKNMFEPSRMIETFVKKKLDLSNLEKPSASVGTIVAPVAIMMRDKAYKKIRRIHSILAMYLLFEEKTVEALLPEDLRRKAHKKMTKIQNGTEKSGIIEGVVNNVPIFIHRVFAEYFGALWLFSNKDLKEVQEFVKQLMYGDNNIAYREVRYFINRLVCRYSPVHLAILDGKIEELLRNNKECMNGKDLWGRTPLHLAYGEEGVRINFVVEWEFLKSLKLLLETTDEKKIDATDDYFGWSALHYATVGFFHSNSISLKNQDILFAPLNSEDPVEIFHGALTIENKLASNVLDTYPPKEVFQPLFKGIARKLIDEKHFDLHSSIKEDTTWNARYEDLPKNQEDLLITATPLELCVFSDSIMLQPLVDAAGGPEKVLSSVASDLLRKAFKQRSFIVLRYFIIDCKFRLSSMNEPEQVFLSLLVYMVYDRQMFRDLFHKYCKQYKIACLDEDQIHESEMSEKKTP